MLKTFEHLFVWWVFYSFVGWVWETLVGLVTRGRFIDRGVLNGPLCPLYGFGCLLIIVVLDDVTNPVALFLSAGFLACLLEYLTSVLMERLFHVKLWDYSDKPFNLNGRVYLLGFVAFGLVASVIKLFVQPRVAHMTDAIPPLALHIACAALLALLLVDVVFSIAGLSSFHGRLSRAAKELETMRKNTLEAADQLIDGDTRERIVQFNEHLHRTFSWQQRRLIDSFPRMTSTSNAHIVSEIRERLEARRAARKQAKQSRRQTSPDDGTLSDDAPSSTSATSSDDR